MVACGLILAACGGGSSSSPDAALPSAPDVVGEAATAGEFCTSKPPVTSVTDLSGMWVVRATGAIIVDAQIIGIMRQQMVLTLLVNITQQGTDLIVDGRYCNRKQVSDPGALTQVIIPDAWAHTETLMHRTGTFAVGETEGFPVLTFPRMAEAMGAVLTPPSEDLPTRADDPRVIDQDNDGKPGITVVLSGIGLSGALYAAQLLTTKVRAIAVAVDRVEGALTFTSAQNVLDSYPSQLKDLYEKGGKSGADPVVCNSGFTMVKLTNAPGIDGGGVTCEWVRDNSVTLFGD
jgi:hypothetical protein